MPFTPDSELDLLFPAEHIPDETKKQLPSDLHLRPLASTDYKRGHLSVLSVLTVVTDPGEGAWVTQFNAIRAASRTYYSIVIVDKPSDRIVAVGTVFIERKFLRGLGSVGHIEDIAVDKSQQGKKLGLRIIQALTGITFYQKCGFERKENEMTRYAPDRSRSPRL
ncbi:uncharacterized protein FIBRA_03845 [Fibroporia radiculosa]|uniref:Glucosamine 6-phosphate N-acetyltransferase n=1 Tax=Fibroporia radiculosa TaxID=599839 RepID=J4G6F2_9APHY|nr:uncharacterized protein FIBRA_03845 [Fibroporia radiculosa]CCM01778.1 predicted protein [Fibroporia radiculosa]